MTDHTVVPGDCIWSLSIKSGHFWKTIWNDSANAQLRQERKDANVLAPGDVVHIPDLRPKTETGATEARHRFRRKGIPCKFRLQILCQGKPRASEAYRLDIDGRLKKGKSDAKGLVEASIPPDAEQGRLIMGDDVYELNLGHLDPVEGIKGAQQRLRNLGLYGGPIDGKDSALTQGAILLFQKRQNLPLTGQLDDTTKDALRTAHHA